MDQVSNFYYALQDVMLNFIHFFSLKIFDAICLSIVNLLRVKKVSDNNEILYCKLCMIEILIANMKPLDDHKGGPHTYGKV